MAISKKICLVGDFSVAKTSLIRRFVDDQFSDEYLSTVGVKLSRKLVEVDATADNAARQVELLIWDIEGQTQFKAIAPSYLQGAKGAIIVADVKRDDTLVHLQNHVDLFVKINPKGTIIIALNKADLVTPTLLATLLDKYALQRHNPRVIDTYATSAKTGQAVNVIFKQLATAILADP
jgi:small GTP-binding protein